MKIISLLLVFSLCGLGSCSNNVENKITYLIMVASPYQEYQASVLIKSIRDFGGDYGRSPILVILADTTQTRGKHLEGMADKIVVLNMNENLRSFPFSDKVYACAQAEQMLAKTCRWLVWLNPDGLMTSPIKEMFSNGTAWASLRPVHIQNVGNAFSDTISMYWKKIYTAVGIEPEMLWKITSYVDNIDLKPYYNSGCMAFDPSKGMLTKWKNVYEEMLSDSGNYNYYTSVSYNSFFFHQAVLSAVIIKNAGQKHLNILPPSYGYPLSQQKREDFVNKIHSLNDMKLVLCENYNYLQWLKIEEPLYSWLKNNIKY